VFCVAPNIQLFPARDIVCDARSYAVDNDVYAEHLPLCVSLYIGLCLRISTATLDGRGEHLVPFEHFALGGTTQEQVPAGLPAAARGDVLLSLFLT